MTIKSVFENRHVLGSIAKIVGQRVWVNVAHFVIDEVLQMVGIAGFLGRTKQNHRSYPSLLGGFELLLSLRS